MPVQPLSCDTSLDQLVSRALVQLEQRGYAANSIKHYRHVWDRFLLFAASSTKNPTLVSEIEVRFLRSHDISQRSKRSELSWSQDVTRRGLRILREIQETGSFNSHAKRTGSLANPVQFALLQQRYETFCQHHLAHRKSTVAGHRRVLKQFCMFLDQRKIVSFCHLKPVQVNQYIAVRAQHVKSVTLATEVGCIRSFLRFLCMEGIIEESLLMHTRTLRSPNEHRLPSIWSADAVESILAAVDRSSAIGKRDFAILLLASRLGLRASDIRSLALENIQWQQDQITLCQCKTGRPLTLPMGEEVGQALIDYLANARPPSTHREVFLKVRAPHEPMGSTNALHSVISAAIARSGIAAPIGKAKGLHSLRHTLATRMVLDGQPLESVAAVLGHRSVETTRLYTHLDCNALICVAINPEQVFA